MSEQRKRGMTLAEHNAQMKAEGRFDEWQREKQQREAERLQLEAELRAAQQPVISDLLRSGFKVESVWDLANTKVPYPDAVPVLLDHVQRPYPVQVREGIARALAVREAKSCFPVLVRLFKDEQHRRVKEGLALAVSGASDDQSLDDVIALARDPQHGPSRVLLLGAISRSRDPRALTALEAMEADPELAKQIKIILRRKKRRKH